MLEKSKKNKLAKHTLNDKWTSLHRATFSFKWSEWEHGSKKVSICGSGLHELTNTFCKKILRHIIKPLRVLSLFLLYDTLWEQRGRFHLRWSLKRGLVLWASECINQKPKWRSNSYRSSRLIKHTKKLMDKEDKLCLKILKTLREMLEKKESFEQSVSTWHFRWL